MTKLRESERIMLMKSSIPTVHPLRENCTPPAIEQVRVKHWLITGLCYIYTFSNEDWTNHSNVIIGHPHDTIVYRHDTTTAHAAYLPTYKPCLNVRIV